MLLTAFAGLVLLVAVLMLRRSQRPEADTAREPGPMLSLRPLACACPRVLKVVVTASAVGLLTGFFGVGGGFALVPALVLALSIPMPVAVGTSLLVIAVNSATALTARASTGATGVDWTVVVAFTVVAVLGSLVGGRLTARLPPRQLNRAFAVLLVAVAAYTAATNAPALF
ncbi:Sulfite exporter TauE/SafE [Pedococcus dokdonensis]|uniref:Probable membrane transporter protein n=1 Tax=Pedococcus dokdonensis TaxID=443156 RepID=A0A1H0U0T5_9MICO|nr:Sulfite exporter TauE/SafE [Pedococcus dokdonensis]